MIDANDIRKLWEFVSLLEERIDKIEEEMEELKERDKNNDKEAD